MHRNEKYIKWGLTAFIVIVCSVVFGVIFTNLTGFYDMILDFLGIISSLLYGCVFASSAMGTFVFVKKQFFLKILTFGIVAPFTFKVAPFKKHGSAYSGAVHKGISFYIKYHRLHIILPFD